MRDKRRWGRRLFAERRQAQKLSLLRPHSAKLGEGERD
jgi:hypothetical protein